LLYKGRKMEATTSTNSDFHGYGEEIRRELGKRIPRRKRLKVLDVGTGFGVNVAFLSSWLAKASEIWTVDPSREVIAEVRAALDTEERASSIRFAVATADKLDFEDGFFDIVVSVMVLHHIKELPAALREMTRVVDTRGRMLVVDYGPEASEKLEFPTRHERSDFFRLDEVVKQVERIGMTARPSDFGVWYLLEATKKKRDSKTPRPVRRVRQHHLVEPAKSRSGR
jgi:ubiquinone/menaquinone biosynthesis C-methylase UbiE